MLEQLHALRTGKSIGQWRMANNEQPGFWGRIRGNAEWDAVKWTWAAARSMLISASYALITYFRHVHVDWIGLAILFVLVMLLSYLMRSQKPKQDPLSPVIEVSQSELSYAPEAPSRKDTPPSVFNAEIYRVVIAPKLPFSEETHNLFKAMGRADEFKIDIDLLVELYIVNTSPETHYIREIIGTLQSDGKKINLTTENGFYAYDINGEHFEWCLDPAPKEFGNFYDREKRLKPLNPVVTRFPIELAPKAPLQGWIRFRASETNPDDLDGKAVYNVSVRDSLGLDHPAAYSRRDNRGEVALRKIAQTG